MPEIQAKKWWNIDIDIGGVSVKDIITFTKHLSVALKSGLTLTEALEMLQEQSTGRLRKMLAELAATIRSGENFSTALAKFPKHFSTIYINLVRTGEIAGTLEENLEHLANELKKADELKRKVRSAMMYPTMVLVAVIGLGLSVAIFVLPKILPLFKTLDVDLPATTKILMWIAEVFKEHGTEILIGTFTAIVLLTMLLRAKFMKPIVHRVILKMPLVKRIIINVNMERFSRTLGTLLSSAVPLVKSLEITAEANPNWVYKQAIKSFMPEVEKGNGLATAMANYPQLFPKLSMRMVAMAEGTGSLDNTLKYLSEMYTDEVDATMKDLSTILEPVLLITIGMAVGGVAIAILGPIYEITGNLRS